MSNQVSSNRLAGDTRYHPSKVANVFTIPLTPSTGVPLPALPPVTLPLTARYGFYFKVCNGVAQTTPVAVETLPYVGVIESTLSDIIPDSPVIGAVRYTRFRVRSAGVYHIQGSFAMSPFTGGAHTAGWCVSVLGDPILYGLQSQTISSTLANNATCGLSVTRYFKAGDSFTIVPIGATSVDASVLPVANAGSADGTTYLSIVKL